MEMKLLGIKFRPLVVILCVLVGMIIENSGFIDRYQSEIYWFNSEIKNVLTSFMNLTLS